MENEIFTILTKVQRDELSRINALDQLALLLNFERGNITCPFCKSANIDKTTGDGIYCNNCHKQL